MGRREASSGCGVLGGGLEREGAWWSARGGEGQVQGYIGHEVGSGLRLGERAGLALGRWGLEAKQEEEGEEEEGAQGVLQLVAGFCRWFDGLPLVRAASF